MGPRTASILRRPMQPTPCLEKSVLSIIKIAAALDNSLARRLLYDQQPAI
jgi:hypothetical protein